MVASMLWKLGGNRVYGRVLRLPTHLVQELNAGDYMIACDDPYPGKF